MKQVIVLDSGPASLGCQAPSKSAAVAFRTWLDGRLAAGVIVCLPEIADYEVRRKLIHIDATSSVQRLDDLARVLHFEPITSATMRLAAQLWADARKRGQPTSGPRALDADSILAAQALLLGGPGDAVTIATENVGHLGQFADVRPWASIG